MKKNSKLSGFYLGLIFVLMYLPIAVVIVFSFNESKLPVRFTGFSLKWYQELIHDDAMLESLGNSLFLGVVSCLVSAVIGTLGAVGLCRIHWKTKGILEYISISAVNDTGNHTWYGTDGFFLYAESALWNADTSYRTYRILRTLYSDGGKGKAGRHGSFSGGGSQRSGGKSFWGIP